MERKSGSQSDESRSPLDMDPDEFRRLGHALVDRLADFLRAMPDGPVTPGETRETVRDALDAGAPLPEDGSDAGDLIERAAGLLIGHSLFNGHPRFWGYITSSAAPIGALADLIAATVNPNVGSWTLAPMATEIEAQSVRWIGELIGYPTSAGGLLVSGGNMANFVCFLAARAARAGSPVRERGLGDGQRLTIYASAEAHTWVQKAADLFGHGTDAIRWVETDSEQRMKPAALVKRIEVDRANGDRPFIVVGNAGSVSTGAVDPLSELRAIALEHDAWFHVDGAYGAFAACVPEAGAALRGMETADSVAVDPHKWLYAPLEAGCAMVRDAGALTRAFAYHPPYYHFDDASLNYVDFGMQNSRGFRALKVWLGLQQAGRRGIAQSIGRNIDLTRRLWERLEGDPEIERVASNLSIATFRYVPADAGRSDVDAEYLNRLNEALLDRIQASGEAFVSNAVVGGRLVLRACIVNFRTTAADVDALPGIVTRFGRELDARMRNLPG